jgi:hypothetical protein
MAGLMQIKAGWMLRQQKAKCRELRRGASRLAQAPDKKDEGTQNVGLR